MRQKQTPAQPVQQENTIPMPYEKDPWLEEIKTLYPGATFGWTSISLGRKDDSGKYPTLRSYPEPPTIDQIQKEYGGGEYRLFLQWKVEGDPERHLDTQIFWIAGPPINPWEKNNTAGITTPAVNGQGNNNAVLNGAAQPPGTYSLTDVLTLAEKLITIGRGGQSAAAPASDGAAIVQAIKSNGEMMTTFVNAMKDINKPVANGDAGFIPMLVKGFLEKSKDTPLKEALSIVDAINNRGSSEKPASGIMEDIKPFIPLLEKFIPGSAMPGAGGVNPAGLGALAGVPGVEGIVAAIQNGFGEIKQEIAGLKNRLSTLENNVDWEEKPVDSNVIDMAANNTVPEDTNTNAGVSGNNTANNDASVQEPLTEKQIMIEENLAKELREAPDPEKVNKLNFFLTQMSVDQIYQWVMYWKAIEPLTLEEFNRILALAGKEKYTPAAQT